MTQSYLDKKLAGVCTYAGCAAPAGETQRCELHAKRHRVSASQHMARMRKLWRRRGLCTRCGRKRSPSSTWGCTKCTIALGATRQRQRGFVGTHVGKSARVRAATTTDATGRVRYHGQGRRGRQTNETEDDCDNRLLDQALARYRDGMALFRSPEIQALPRIQRLDCKQAALAQLDLVKRHVQDLLDRHRYSTPSQRNDED